MRAKNKYNEEDLKLDAENKAARPYYRGDGIKALWAAVTLRVMKAHEIAIRRGNPNIARDCEAFFETEAFGCLSGGWTAEEVRKAIQQHVEGGPNEGISAWGYRRPRGVHLA